MTSQVITNKKGATAFSTTFNDVLDLYTNQLKSLPTDSDKFSDLINTIENSFINNPELTIKLLKYKRLIKKGDGLRMLPFVMMMMVKKQDYEVYKQMLSWFNESDKDLLRLARMSRMFLKYVDNIELELYTDNLFNTLMSVLNGDTLVNLLPIKYLPSNGNHFDYERRIIRDLLNLKLMLNKSKLGLDNTEFKTEQQQFLTELLNNTFNTTNMFVNNRVLRQLKTYFDKKQFLATPLLKLEPFQHLETDEEKYKMVGTYLSKLSTQAFNNVKKTIEKSNNDYLTKGLDEYKNLISLKPETVKTNGLVLTDQLYQVYMGSQQFDNVLEAQVNKQAQELREYLNVSNDFVSSLLLVIDESGSMNGTPLNTALYHTLLMWIAFELPSVIFFSDNCKYVELPSGLSVYDKIKFLYKRTTGSTNLESVFQYMIKNNIKNKQVVIMTDGDCDYCFMKNYTNNPFHLYLNKVQSNICVFNLKQDKLCFPYLAEDARTCYLGGNNIKVLVGFTKALAQSILDKTPITPTSILHHSLNLEELEHNYKFKYMNRLTDTDKTNLLNTIKYNIPLKHKQNQTDSVCEDDNLSQSNADNSSNTDNSSHDELDTEWANSNVNTFMNKLKSMVV